MHRSHSQNLDNLPKEICGHIDTEFDSVVANNWCSDLIKSQFASILRQRRRRMSGNIGAADAQYDRDVITGGYTRTGRLL